MLGDVHGGAGEQALQLYQEILDLSSDRSLDRAIHESLDRLSSNDIRFVPGFGHRFHKPEDPERNLS